MNTTRPGLLGILLAAWLSCMLGTGIAAEPRHGIAMHGEPKYAPGFAHFNYVNPQAPRGGTLALGVNGSFDSLNPLIVRGNKAPGVREYVYESLMARASDEPFSLYGLLAESIEVPDDRSWVAFTLRPEARFSDGRPVTVDDVIFSWKLLRDKGLPTVHRSYYSKVERIERVGERGVKMIFRDGSDREMPLIIGLMPILPKHLIDPETFEKTTLAPPVGSGPYVAAEVAPGSRLVFRRNPEYWGRNLPVNRGLFNFDEIRYDFYRDRNSMFEAFKKGLIDFMGEADPGRWARDYDFPAVTEGRIVKKSFTTGLPSGMTGLVFNTRRPLFADSRVRQAFNLLFDFEWLNKNLFHGLYKRTQSYFDKSELSSHGRPASAHERELLAPFPGAVTPEAMEGTLRQPVTDGSGRDRSNRRMAFRLLREAGYELAGGKLVHKATGTPVSFEMLAATREQERLFLTSARELRKAGIDVRIRQIDPAQFQARKVRFDFDMIENTWPSSLSPGNEQNNRWSSAAANMEGSFNYPAVKSPAADAMIAALLAARSRDDFVAAVRALDRVLMSGAYVIPLYHLPQQWVAFNAGLAQPKVAPLAGIRIDSWWRKDATRQTWAP